MLSFPFEIEYILQNKLKLKYGLYFVTVQPWNAFEDSGTHLHVDSVSQELKLHNFPSADNQILGLRASEVGVSMLYYHDSLYDLERNSLAPFFLLHPL